MSEDQTDWKLKLRYGKLTTNFSHFTILADGIVGELVNGFDCPSGPAWMAMKAWAEHAGEADHMTRLIAGQIGFTVTGKVFVYVTEPEVPPQENPHGYDINFKPYN